MIIYQREFLSQETVEEVKTMSAEHNNEINGDRPLKMDWNRYIEMDKNGLIGAYMVRDNGALVGYAMYTIMPDPHSVGQKIAYQDSLYVTPEYRKKGVGIKLIKYTEEKLKYFGVRNITQMVMDTVDFSKVLLRMGYKSTGHVYTKEI